MTLALVIPVRNDGRNLDALLHQACGMAIFDQIIVVDDASDTPVAPDANLRDTQGRRITVLRQKTAGGAGAARNAGMPLVDTSHVILFDSDDQFTPEFCDLWRDLAGETFDFCLMRYQDSEQAAVGRWGQTPHDEACWSRAAIGSSPKKEVTGSSIWPLSEAANFPWNKIYRSAFLRDNGLRCSPTKVHNDIALHWGSFVAANRILVSARIGALHVVHPTGNRITNQSGQARLQVFEALDHAATYLSDAPPDSPALCAFLRFASGLLIWVERVIDPEFRAEYFDLLSSFMRRMLSDEFYAVLLKDDPVLALQVCLQMAPVEKAVAPC